VDDHETPTIGLSGPTVSAANATMTVSAQDADDPVGGLRRECLLDAGAWASCLSTWALTGLSAGPHTVQARAADAGGRVSTIASRTWVVDRAAPTATLAKVAKHSGTRLTLHWTGRDTGGAGVASYEIRQRSARTGKRWGAWHTTVVRGTSLTVKLKGKHRYGFEVRAHDAAGNVGSWSTARTTSVR
jgi:predicted phage tail protein